MVCIKPFIKSAIKLHAQNSEWILKSEAGKAETFQILQQNEAYFITTSSFLLRYQENWSNKKYTHPKNPPPWSSCIEKNSLSCATHKFSPPKHYPSSKMMRMLINCCVCSVLSTALPWNDWWWDRGKYNANLKMSELILFFPRRSEKKH